MQIISTINSFVQLQGTSYYKKNNFTFCPGKSRQNSINIFQDFPGLTNKIQGLSRTFQDSKKNPGLSRTFPGCGNPDQDSAVLISVVTQRGILVVGIVYGCPYFKDPATFSLVSKVPQVKKSFIPY